MNVKNKGGRISYEELKEIISYDKESGAFTWRDKRNGIKGVGRIAGCVDNRGYRRISIDGKRYLAHRLAWLYIYGHFPENDIDHINRIKDDNRIENLREVSKSCNMRNRSLMRKSISGVTGVTWYDERYRWVAKIRVDGKLLHLGYFDKVIDAAKARWEAEKKYDFPGCNTSSSALMYIRERRNG